MCISLLFSLSHSIWLSSSQQCCWNWISHRFSWMVLLTQWWNVSGLTFQCLRFTPDPSQPDILPKVWFSFRISMSISGQNIMSSTEIPLPHTSNRWCFSLLYHLNASHQIWSPYGLRYRNKCNTWLDESDFGQPPLGNIRLIAIVW